MPGSTSAKRAVFKIQAWEELQALLRSENISMRDLEQLLPVSQKVLARAFGGPPQKSTNAERKTRGIIEKMAASFKIVARRERFLQLVALNNIPAETFICFVGLFKERRERDGLNEKTDGPF